MIGVYIFISLVFVVATVFQMTALLLLKQKAEQKVSSLEAGKKTNIRNSTISHELIKRIDNMCAVLFPLSFIAFNGIYIASMM